MLGLGKIASDRKARLLERAKPPEIRFLGGTELRAGENGAPGIAARENTETGWHVDDEGQGVPPMKPPKRKSPKVLDPYPRLVFHPDRDLFLRFKKATKARKLTMATVLRHLMRTYLMACEAKERAEAAGS